MNIFNLASPVLRFHNSNIIYFQGGVASNAGMFEALKELFRMKIVVPELAAIDGIYKIMGAIGASHLAEQYWPIIRFQKELV
jgi:activator of 2-hydroxyglutaryl-CoA dehydratase